MTGPFNIPRLELDPTGTNSNNKIENELHIINSNTLVRSIAPNYGPFFDESLIVKDSVGNTLKRGIDYQIVELHQEATLKYGKAISSVILIINNSVGPNVSITYQALGGHYSYDNTAIANLYQSVINDNRPVDWSNVLNKPLEYPPSPHFHLLENIVGFEYIVDYLERIKQAISLGQVRVVSEIIKNLYGVPKCKEVLKILPTKGFISHDAFLYFITRKKLLYNIWIDTKDCIWYKGDTATVQVDTSGYSVGTTLFWEFYKPNGTPINIFSNQKGTIKSNGGIVEFNIYVPSVDNVKDDPIYIGIKDNQTSEDFKAVTYQIDIAEHVVTNETSPLVMNLDINTNITLINNDDYYYYTLTMMTIITIH